jgi:predicted metalloenzyme YecM
MITLLYRCASSAINNRRLNIRTPPRSQRNLPMTTNHNASVDTPTTTTTDDATPADKFLNTLRVQVPKFLPLVTSQLLDTYGIDVTPLVADHVCWRTETMEEYADLVGSLKKENHRKNHAKLLIESEIGGRPIATFRLLEEIKCNQDHHTVDIIEIPAPKAGSPYRSGLEHVEFVIGALNNNDNNDNKNAVVVTTCPLNDSKHQAALDAFMARHSSIQWNTKAKTKANNPDISLKLEELGESFGTCTVKFHLMPLDRVIEWETNQATKTATTL